MKVEGKSETDTTTGTSPAATETATEGGSVAPGSHESEVKETPTKSDDTTDEGDGKEGAASDETSDTDEDEGGEGSEKTDPDGKVEDPADDLPDDPAAIREWLEARSGKPAETASQDPKPDIDANAKPLTKVFEDFKETVEKVWSEFDSGYRDAEDNPVPNPFEVALVDALAPIFEMAEEFRVQRERQVESEIMDRAAQFLSASKSASKVLAEDTGLKLSALQIAKDVERTAEFYAKAKGIKLEDLPMTTETVVAIVKMANSEKVEEALRNKQKKRTTPAPVSRGGGGAERPKVAGTSFHDHYAGVQGRR